MIRRLLGLIIILISLTGVAVSIGGILRGQELIDSVASVVGDGLSLTSQTLDTVEDTLLLTKSTVKTVNNSVEAVDTTAEDVAFVLNQTQPLLNQLGAISSEDLPQSLETIQETMPTLADVAGTVDSTLTTLSNIEFEETIPIINYTVSWSLGVEYDPEIPLEESVVRIGDSLEGLPAQLRGLRVYVNMTSDGMQTISGDLRLISSELKSVSAQLDEVDPLLDEYLATAVQLNDTTRQTRTGINSQLESIKLGITIVMIWLALAQLAPLYLGFELLLGRRGRPAAATDT